MGSSLKRTTIFLTREQHERLRRMAFEQRRSMAELVRMAILDILEDGENPHQGLKVTEGGKGVSLPSANLERSRAEKEKGR